MIRNRIRIQKAQKLIEPDPEHYTPVQKTEPTESVLVFFKICYICLESD
jgi:hypothetical protein